MTELETVLEENRKLRQALLSIVAASNDVRRYRNMRAFPIVKSLIIKMANMGREALDHQIVSEEDY